MSPTHAYTQRFCVMYQRHVVKLTYTGVWPLTRTLSTSLTSMKMSTGDSTAFLLWWNGKFLNTLYMKYHLVHVQYACQGCHFLELSVPFLAQFTYMLPSHCMYTHTISHVHLHCTCIWTNHETLSTQHKFNLPNPVIFKEKWVGSTGIYGTVVGVAYNDVALSPSLNQLAMPPRNYDGGVYTNIPVDPWVASSGTLTCDIHVHVLYIHVQLYRSWSTNITIIELITFMYVWL